MRAWQVYRHGEPVDVLRLAEIDTPEPAPDQVRVRVLAAALALPDVMMCRGTYAFAPTMPFTPGSGSGRRDHRRRRRRQHLSVGQRVMAITKFEIGHGGFADEALAGAANAYAVPDGMSDADGAGFLIAYLTGWLGLVTRGKMERGEWLAVFGAAGGTGSAAIQIGHALGARVIAVVGGPDKAEYCRGLGAEYTIDHRNESVGDRLREITGGHGADLVYDPVGGTPAHRIDQGHRQRRPPARRGVRERRVDASQLA